MRLAICAAAALAMLVTTAARSQAQPTVTLLTYNVRGLPWPVATDRTAALAAIARHLRALRQQGRQPGLVALQEAFIPDAKAIGRAAGYQFMALGPGLDASPARATTAADRAFMADRSFMVGERVGKRVDSGLVIFSDYPIVAVRRMVYAVCAGFDCLANKGALAVEVAVPGVPARLVVIDSHLNSGAASGTVRARSNYAYYRQIDALRDFIADVAADGAPVLVAGDLNVGQRQERRSYFVTSLLGRSSGIAAAEFSCGQEQRCSIGSQTGVAESRESGKDWLLYRSSPSLAMKPTRLNAEFSRAVGGGMLSDHIGISATYALGAPFRR